jgi:hypothetical protein
MKKRTRNKRQGSRKKEENPNTKIQKTSSKEIQGTRCKAQGGKSNVQKNKK